MKTLHEIIKRAGAVLLHNEVANMKLQQLFEQVVAQNPPFATTLIFNLYEDSARFTVEAVLDDEAVVIGRDNPAIVCNAACGYEAALELFQSKAKVFYEENKAALSNFKEISYGFVDGDLFYIKRPRSRRGAKQQKRYTPADFESFSPFKLHAWIVVYVDQDKKEEFGLPLFAPKEMNSAEHKRYREFLAENFNYEKKAQLNK